MIATWIFLLLISLNGYSQVRSEGEETIKAKMVKTTRTFKSSAIGNSKQFMVALKRSPQALKRFLRWIKAHVKYGIQCVDFGVNQMKCRTKGGANMKISMKNWKRLPPFLRKRWTKTVVTSTTTF